MAIGVSAYLIIESAREAGDAVVITVNGDFLAEYPLGENREYSLAGGKNILAIDNGKAYMKNADCPDKLCMHQGRISQTGERIVCLPNRVMVEVIGHGDEIFAN